jgi:intron-binding protein aquarius
VLGRRELFESSLEVNETFALLLTRPDKLAVVTGETFPTSRKLDDEVPFTEMQGVEHLGQYVFEMTEAMVAALKEGGGTLPPLAERPDDMETYEQSEEEAAVGDAVESAPLEDDSQM